MATDKETTRSVTELLKLRHQPPEWAVFTKYLAQALDCREEDLDKRFVATIVECLRQWNAQSGKGEKQT